MSDVERSKRLAYVLRHRPDSVGIELDAQGWVDVDVLLEALGRHGTPISAAQLERLVEVDGKRRYAFDESGTQVRALQGHSVEVALEHPVVTPPPVLFHGTVERFVASIEADGLRAGERHHVHLSEDEETARVVAKRRGNPVVFLVDAAGMVAGGFTFQLAPNGVWLVASVPASYLRRM
ncbi:MAG: RNA 2'-phosphotransferase [Myxococcota bacterium]